MGQVPIILNDGKTLFKEVVADLSITTDPASISDGASATITFAVPGATFGDFVLVAPPYDIKGLEPGMPYVSDDDEVSIVLTNNTGSAVDLDEGDWRVKVLR